MSTRTVQFLITVPAQSEPSPARQFLLNLAVSLEPATEEDSLAGIELTLCSGEEGTGTDPVPCSPGPPLENPNPNG